MILIVIAENGKRFRIECNRKRVLKLNGRKCTFLKKSCRRVYRCGRYVIKLDGDDLSWDYTRQNRDELANWRKIKLKDRKYFAKVIGMKDSGRGWSVLVQEYVEGKKSRQSHKIEEVANRYGMCDVGPQHNFLMRKGRPVIYDLGV